LSGIFGSVAIPSGTQEKLPPFLREGSECIWLAAFIWDEVSLAVAAPIGSNGLDDVQLMLKQQVF
jgi:hypothetical protein